MVRRNKVTVRRNKVTGRGGDPYINLCFAVLVEAKRGNTKMWQDFEKEHDMMKPYPEAFGVALWVSEWWQKDLAGAIEYGLEEPTEER